MAYVIDSGEQRSLSERILRRWEDLKALRVGWEGTWQEISDYFLPRRDFQVHKFPGELIDRRLLDATGMISNDRLTAMLFGFLVSANVPFVRPRFGRGVQRRGGVPQIDDEGTDWLDGVQWSMHDHMMATKSGFKTSGFESLSEYVAFGNGVFFTGARPGFGAFYQSRPLQSCWFAANADDEVDTLYYAFTLPAWRVVQRWPAAGELECLQAAMKDRQNKAVKLLYAVEPREGGRPGAGSNRKPWQANLMLLDDKAVIEESGFESFPYAVPRFYLKPGEVYGYGPGHVALPDVRMLNAMMESVLRAAELRNDPPLMVPLRMFSRPIQRRRGTVNYYQANQLGLQTAEQAVRPLNVAGDVSVSVELIRELRQQVEYAFFTDWMRLRENGTMTATEVNDRRDLRLRGMSPIVGRAESDWMGPTADRTFEINMAMGYFGPPPESLQGGILSWGYTGPMALAQLQGEAEAVGIVSAYAMQLAQVDPAAAKTFDASAGMRVLADAKGLPPGVLRTREAVAAMAAQQEQQEQEAADAQGTEQQARAFKDGAQGVQHLATAMDQTGGGGMQEAA